MTNIDQMLAVPHETHRYFDDVNALLPHLPGPIMPIGEAFRTNLEAVTRMVSVPYRVIHVINLPEVNEKIRAGLRDAWSAKASGTSIVDLLQAKADALKEFTEELTELHLPDAREKIRKSTEQALQDEDVMLGVRELFLQALVLAWGAFEILGRDALINILNARPSFVTSLTQNPRAKKRMKDVTLDLARLAEWQFDLSHQLGDYLGKQLSFCTLSILRDLFMALCPEDNELNRFLKDDRLYLLGQRRHLIVHRRAIIDQEFLNKTHSRHSIGDKLEVTLDDLRESLGIVMEAGLATLRAARNLLDRAPDLTDPLFPLGHEDSG